MKIFGSLDSVLPQLADFRQNVLPRVLAFSAAEDDNQYIVWYTGNRTTELPWTVTIVSPLVSATQIDLVGA